MTLTGLTIHSLKMITDLSQGAVVRTTGYYEPGDGGAAEYIVRAASEPEDGGGVIQLRNGLQAHLLPGSAVHYRMFGAVGDGTNDDGVQIKLAHAYANAKKLPLVNASGEFWIKETNRIEIRTNVEWGHTVFHIDESFNSPVNPRFQVPSAKSPVEIALEPAAKAALLSKLKPGTTLIPELAAYKNCLIFVADKNDRIGLRQGYLKDWDKEEFFYVEEHGRIIGDLAWTFRDYTSLTAYPCDDNYLIIDGGTFYMTGNNPGDRSNAKYKHNGFSIARSRTVIRNQWVGLEPGMEDISLSQRSAFYSFTRAYDVLLENVRLIPWEKNRVDPDRVVPEGTYGIGGNRVLNPTFRNLTAEGSQVHWGVFGTNLFKNFRVENCRLNRIDVHFHCWNLYVKDCELGYKGFTLTGGGDLFIENTKRFGNRFIEFRRDYGAKWDGNIRLKNCRLIVTNGEHEAVALNYQPFDFDYKYPVGYGRSVRVEDFIFDFTGNENFRTVCWVMKLADFSKMSSGQKLFFPNQIEFKNVSVDGREQGVRMVKIPDPQGFDLRRKGGYDGHSLLTNCYMRFENIQSERIPAQAPSSAKHVHFLLGAAEMPIGGAGLYPKIDFINCGDLFAIMSGSCADVSFSRCTIQAVGSHEGAPLNGKLLFDNCDIQANVLDDGHPFGSFEATLGTTFLNCTVQAPLVDGKARPDLVNRYGFIEVNDILRYNHLNTRLSHAIVNHYEPVQPEFYAMLKSHHESESIRMTRRKGASAQRPESGLEAGFTYFDTDLKQFTVWDGGGWIVPGKGEDTLHFYASSIGTRMKRMEGHPTQEYVMPKPGSLRQYAVYVGTHAGSIVLELIKNGEHWFSESVSAEAGNPRFVTAAGDSRFIAGDRIGIRLAEANAKPDSGVTVDLYVQYMYS